MTVDSAGLVYVLNNGHYDSRFHPIGDSSIDVYAPGANGTVAPIRTIAGKKTGLGNSPLDQSIALDGRGNVAVITSRSYRDPASESDVRFYDAQANGDVAPLRTILSLRATSGDFQALSSDDAGDVAVLLRKRDAPYAKSINVYGPQANQTSAPARSIDGKYLSEAIGIAFSHSGAIAADNRFLSNIVFFAPGAGGDATPTRTITTPKALILGAMAFDAVGDLAVITPDYDPNIFWEALVFGPNDTNMLAPSRTLRGNNTGLDYAQSIAFGP